MKLQLLLIYLLVLKGFSQESADLSKVREAGRLQSAFLTNYQKVVSGLRERQADLAGYEKWVAPLLEKNCLDCHGPKKAKGRFRVDQLNPNLQEGDSAARWLEVYEVLSNAEMPPDDEVDYHLNDQERNQLIEWLGDEINKAAASKRQEAGHTSFRRMTKYEYNYALQDLLGLPYKFSDDLPPETYSEDGFQNSSEHLHMTAMQFETYRELALKALKKVTVSGDQPKPVFYDITMGKAMAIAKERKAELINRKAKNYPQKSREAHLTDKVTGKGVIWDWKYYKGLWGFKPSEHKAKDIRESSLIAVLPHYKHMKFDLGNFLPDKGLMRVRIRAGKSRRRDDEVARLRLLFGARSSHSGNYWERAGVEDLLVTASADNPEYIEYDIPLTEVYRNPFKNTAELGGIPNPAEGIHIQNVTNTKRKYEADALKIIIDHIEIEAPVYEQWPPQSHVNIFIPSENKADEEKYCHEILTKFIAKAWRRPVTDEDIEPFIELFSRLRPDCQTFEDAIVEVLAVVLSTPQFLYLQSKPESDTSKTMNDFQLANRLSFFLWSSVPDDELLNLAVSKKLSDPKVLRAQTERMLQDPKALRFSQNFVRQWLGMVALEHLNVDRKVNRSFHSLKAHMQQEPVEYFREVVRNNNSVMDFIHSDYAVVNERLAAHYGIRGVVGSHFRKVELDSNQRGGILTTAGVLAMNADGKDSNPLKRGIWLLEKILHDPPPPPPPNVPEVDLTDPEILKMTLKERIEHHRNNPACRSCHAKIDPWGIAFENYDAMGSYRTQIDKKPVDATASLFNKHELKGMVGLKKYLLSERQDQFAKAMVHKMASYALGRPLSFNDHADVHEMTAALRQKGDGLEDLIHVIIQSKLFQRY